MKTEKTHEMRRPRVAVVGGGFAGQAVVKGLSRAPVDILLIDKNNSQTFQPLLYQVATAALEPEEIVYPIEQSFRSQNNVRFLQASVIGVDWHKHHLWLAGQDPVPFDYLVLAAGSTPEYFNIPGADVHSFPLKHLSDALELRTHLLKLFGRVENNPALAQSGLLNLVIVGGGPTGVEMAGSVSDLLNKLRQEYPKLPFEKARIVLLEAGSALLTPFDKSAREQVQQILSEQKIHVACNQKVVKVTDRAVYLESRKVIPTATTIWAVGVRASPLADMLGLPQTKSGRIIVNDDLSVPGRPTVFVAGDMAGCAQGVNGMHCQRASVARQGGKHVARQIRNQLKAAPSSAFTLDQSRMVATIGRHTAIADLKEEMPLGGWRAQLAWIGEHFMLLTGFRNRLHMLTRWIRHLLGIHHVPRLIHESPKEKPTFRKRPPTPSLPKVNVPEKAPKAPTYRAPAHSDEMVTG